MTLDRRNYYARVNCRTVYVYRREGGGGVPVSCETYMGGHEAERAARVFNASGYLPSPLELEAVSEE